MNGVDAVAIALGQDWRAIESASHAYASMGGKYKPLTEYKIEEDEAGQRFFVGMMELPLAVGSTGGSIKSSAAYQNTHYILGYPNASEISSIMVSVGLA